MDLNKTGSIQDITLYSKELGEEVDMLLYLPPTFSTLYKYSLLIAQDGRDYFTLGRIATLAGELIGERQIDNTIIVGIPYKNVEDRREKYHPNGSRHEAYIRFLAHELVPYLDKELPTYQMGHGRALIGDSLAGTVSLLAGLSYPHTFGKLILQSPYVNGYVLDKAKTFGEPHLLEIYHSIGQKETAVETTDGKTKDFITPNRELHHVMKDRRFSHYYREFDGDHTWTHWQPDLKCALLKMLVF